MWQGVSDIFTQILSVLQKSKGVLPCFTPREKPDGWRRKQSRRCEGGGGRGESRGDEGAVRVNVQKVARKKSNKKTKTEENNIKMK